MRHIWLGRWTTLGCLLVVRKPERASCAESGIWSVWRRVIFLARKLRDEYS